VERSHAVALLGAAACDDLRIPPAAATHAVALLGAAACDIHSAPRAVIEEFAADGLVVRLLVDMGLPPRLIVGESMRLVVLTPDGPEAGLVEVLEPCEPPLGRPKGRCYRLSMPTAIEGFQRRAHARMTLPLDFRARVELISGRQAPAGTATDHRTMVGSLLDLSELGMKVVVDEDHAPMVGAPVEVSVRFQEPLPRLAAAGEIIHAMPHRRAGEFAIGLRFARTPDGVTEILRELERRRAQRAGRRRAG
jgi:hypothetical protein